MPYLKKSVYLLIFLFLIRSDNADDNEWPPWHVYGPPSDHHHPSLTRQATSTQTHWQTNTNTWTMTNRELQMHLLLKSPVFLLPPRVQQHPPPQRRWMGFGGGILCMGLEMQMSPVPQFSVRFFKLCFWSPTCFSSLFLLLGYHFSCVLVLHTTTTKLISYCMSLPKKNRVYNDSTLDYKFFVKYKYIQFYMTE